MNNICFLIGNINNSGGTERVCSIIANEFAKNGYNVSILSLVEGNKPFFKLHPNVEIYNLYSKKISFKKSFFSVVLKVRQFVKQHRINTLIVVDSISCMFTVPALCGLNVKHVCWEHFNFNINLGLRSRDLGRKLAAKYCDYVITLTQKDKYLWEQGLKNIQAKVVPIANPSPYKNIENKPSLDSKTLLSIGRLTNQKGFDLLIEAWGLVCQTNRDWILRIVGDGEDEQALKNQVKKLGISNRIEFIPVTKDIEYYYKNSSFYCLSSRYEGLPMVLLEAQAFGLPIIAFDCDTGPSEIINNKNGWLVPPKSIQELSNMILEAINVDSSTYECYVKNSYSSNKRFNIDNIIYKWKEIF